MTASIAAQTAIDDLRRALADDAAFEAWYRRTVPRVYSYLLARCGDIDDERVTHEAVQWNRVNRLMSLREMNRRIDVRAAVLGREQAVRSVVIPSRRDAFRILAKPEAFRSRPVDRLRVVGVREIDELPLRKRRSCGSTAGSRHQQQ